MTTKIGGSIGLTLDTSTGAPRIQGDFSNAAIASRIMFQSSTLNGATNLGLVPNGSSTQSSIGVFNSSDPTNASTASILVNGSESRFSAGQTGTGIYLPMTLYSGGSQSLNLATDGTFTSVKGPIGYSNGAGGTVVQQTSKTTAVTLNKPTGQITMNNAALASGAAVIFVLNNSLVTSSDTAIACQGGIYGANTNYLVQVLGCSNGAVTLRLVNISGASLTDAVVINFTIIKGATA